MNVTLKRCFKYLGIMTLIALSAIAALAFKPIPVTIKPIQANADTHYWIMAGGYKIAYRRTPAATGNGDNTPIIFLHGGPGGYIHSEVIRTLSPISADGRVLFFYDQSGTGLSDRRARPKDTTLRGHIADLHEIITRHINAEKVVIIGHSYGAQIATGFAVAHPELIDRVVLSSPGDIDPVVYDENGKPLNLNKYPTPANLAFRSADPNNVAHAKEGIEAMPVRAIISLASATLLNRKFAPDQEVDNALNTMASRFTEHMVCNPKSVKPEEGGGGMYSRVGSNFYEDADNPRPLMSTMKAPVLVLQGSCDFIAYGDAYEYVALFPNARYRFINGAGHIIWWDKPEAYRNEIRIFLSASAP